MKKTKENRAARLRLIESLQDEEIIDSENNGTEENKQNWGHLYQVIEKSRKQIEHAYIFLKKDGEDLIIEQDTFCKLHRLVEYVKGMEEFLLEKAIENQQR